MLAGLSGRELGRAAGVSQSTVSPGRTRTSRAVPARGHRLGRRHITGDRRAVLLALAEAALNEVTTFRVRVPLQNSIRVPGPAVWQVD
jgi:hypothetical protein